MSDLGCRVYIPDPAHCEEGLIGGREIADRGAVLQEAGKH